VQEHPARRLWSALEPVHDVVYFSPQVRETGLSLGLRGFWMTYFVFRAAPLGRVEADPVIAMFAGFEPGMVAKALPDAWSRADPEACLAARAAVSAAVLRQTGVEEAAFAKAAELLAPLALRADRTGRPLFAANAVLPLGTDPVAAVWQLATSLREHRGDGHVAALVAAGISGLEAHLLQVAAGRIPAEAILMARGWSERDWSDAAARLRDRGLLTGDAPVALTDLGAACRQEIEAATDNSSWVGALASLGEAGVDQVVELLAPAVRALHAAGIPPAINPGGLPTG
jgi:hypothetical protein